MNRTYHKDGSQPPEGYIYLSIDELAVAAWFVIALLFASAGGN